MTLYEISEDLQEIESRLIEAGGELPDEDFEAWFDSIKDQRNAKLDSYCALIREIETRTKARETEAKRLLELAASDTKAADRLKDRLKWFFEKHALTKLETPRFRLGLQNAGGVLPLRIDDTVKAEDVDERFHKVVPARVEFDKDTVRQALESGEYLTFARFGERGKRMVIK